MIGLLEFLVWLMFILVAVLLIGCILGLMAYMVYSLWQEIRR